MTIINLITDTAVELGLPHGDAARKWSQRQAGPERLTLNQIYETATQLKSSNNADALKRWLTGTPAWELGIDGTKLTCASFKQPTGTNNCH